MIKHIFIFLLISSQAFAQLEQTKRFEVEVKRSDELFNIISADSAGLFLFQETKNYDGRNKIWNLSYLDDRLKKQQEHTLLINGRYNWIGHEYNSPYLYLLFRQGEVNTNDLHVIRVSLGNDSIISRFDIKNEIDFNITHFTVCKNSALMGGYVDNRPALILYSFNDEKIKVLPGFYQKDAQLIDITVNANNTFNVLISNEKHVTKKNLELKLFDPQGNLLAEDAFLIPEGKDVMTGLTSRLKNENLIVTGAFGSSNSKLAEGIYWAKADLSKEQTLKLIPFIDFNTIYDYLSEKRRTKMRERAERKRDNNMFFEKEHIYIHRVFESNGKYYLMLEIFDPYTQRNNMAAPYSISQRNYYLYPYSRFYSRLPNVYNVNEYSKIKYQQAIVAAINDKGEILWDHSIVFDKKDSERLQQISDITLLNDKVAIAYKDEEELHWKMINSGEASEDAQQVEVMISNPTDVIRNEVESEGGIRYWYDGVFYIWGYQSIKRRTDDGKNDRIDVFYINKMEMAE